MTFPRLRRDDPLEVVRHLVTEVGTRRATSLAEADAAAYVDSRLRLAGLNVNADGFRAAISLGLTYPLLSLMGIAASLLSVWMVLPAFLLALYALILTVSDALSAPLPSLAPHRDSQNIVATRARVTNDEQAAPLPRWRVVVLAPLDADGEKIGMHRIVSGQTLSIIGRVVALLILVALLMILLFDPRDQWRYLQCIPIAYLLFTLWPGSTRVSHASLLGSAGALAVLLASVERIGSLHSVELWTVALGATATGNRGLRDFLTRYPFSRDDTLFIVLQSITSGQLVYASREGVVGQYAADALLAHLIKSTATADPQIQVRTCRYLTASSIAGVLHSSGYRTITLFTETAPDPFPTPEEDAILEPFRDGILERSTRLLAGMIQRLDSEETG